MGVASLNLQAQSSNATNNGNSLILISSWTDTTGHVHQLADVAFHTTPTAVIG
jgi:hypothetical protein